MLRWLPKAFNSQISPSLAEIDLYPSHLQAKIDAISPWMQSDVNSGVYKAGFTDSQEEYNDKVVRVFGALNKLERIIAQNGGPFVLGKEMTELDVMLYTTLIRFDVVYVEHFKCNLGTIRHDYPVLHNWLKGMYWDVEAARDTTDFKHIKENVSHPITSRRYVLIGLVYEEPLAHQPQGDHTAGPMSRHRGGGGEGLDQVACRRGEASSRVGT